MTDIIERISVSTPKYNMDQFIITSSFDFADRVDSIGHSQGATVGLNVPSGIHLLPEAIYSFDGGLSWWDAGGYSNPTGFTLEPAIPLDLSYDIDNQNLIIIGTQRALVSGGGSFTLTIKVGVALPPGYSTYDLSLYDNYFTGSDAYSSKLSYLKIAKQDSFSYVAGAARTTTIAHNLGYVPFVQAWLWDPGIGVNFIKKMHCSFGNPGSPLDYVQVDETNLYIHTFNRTGEGSPTVKLFYKIYYGNY